VTDSNQLRPVYVPSVDSAKPDCGWPRCESSTTRPAATAPMPARIHLVADTTAPRSRVTKRVCGTRRRGRLTRSNTTSASRPYAPPGAEGTILETKPDGTCLVELVLTPQTADADGDFVQVVLSESQYEIIPDAPAR
jgi:hypothetical protein